MTKFLPSTNKNAERTKGAEANNLRCPVFLAFLGRRDILTFVLYLNGLDHKVVYQTMLRPIDDLDKIMFLV